MDQPVVDQVERRPAPHLRSFVERYGGYRLEGLPSGSHRGLPSHSITLILSLGSPIHIAAMPDPAQAPGSFGAFVGGLHAAPATVVHDGRQHGVHLRLTPLGSRALLGLPAGELSSAVVDLADLLGPTAAELADRLEAATGWPARFAVLDEVLGALAADVPAPPPEVAWAWRQLVGSGGAVEVGALAEEVGWSRRHLGERFRRELGLAPKVAARVVRFERACTMLERPPPRPGLAEVAAACGYFDQAHMSREWRQLAGCSPTTWMAEELPSVQDSGVDTRAS